jgi:hypothetical protein
MCGFYIAIKWNLRLTIFSPHIDDGGCVVYMWFLYRYAMKADHIWSTHWRWRVCGVCVVYILPYNEGWPYLVHTLMMKRVQCMSGFYIAIQWSLKADHIWSTHWRWRVRSVCVVSILPYNDGWPYLVHTLMMEGV